MSKKKYLVYTTKDNVKQDLEYKITSKENPAKKYTTFKMFRSDGAPWTVDSRGKKLFTIKDGFDGSISINCHEYDMSNYMEFHSLHELGILINLIMRKESDYEIVEMKKYEKV